MWKTLFGSGSGPSTTPENEDITGQSVSSGDSDVDLPGADIDDGGDAPPGMPVNSTPQVMQPSTPESLQQPSMPAWEPPAHLDLRPCDVCHYFSYLRKKACVNSECVIQ